MDERLAKCHETYQRGTSDKAWWPKQKAFLAHFRRTLNLSLAINLVYSISQPSALRSWVSRIRQMPKMQRAMTDIVQDEFEKVGLTDEVAASRLARLILDDEDGKVCLGALRTYYEIKGKIGQARHKKELPSGAYIDFTDLIQRALVGQPAPLVEGVSLGGIHGPESILPSGDFESSGRSEEEEEVYYSSQGIGQDHIEDR